MNKYHYWFYEISTKRLQSYRTIHALNIESAVKEIYEVHSVPDEDTELRIRFKGEIRCQPNEAENLARD